MIKVGKYLHFDLKRVMDWLIKAALLNGKALAISVIIWHLKGLKLSNTVKLNEKLLKEFKINR